MPTGFGFPRRLVRCGQCGILRIVWYDAYYVKRATLTSTSYLVLGLLAREGPSTPYDLERHVRATLGNFWSFPHTLLYSEPPRLAAMGLLTETRETEGRRRRVFTITTAGVAALDAWLDRPSDAPTELRDPGLLQLFFADLASADARLRLAEQQLAIHRAKLAAYKEDERFERSPGRRRKGRADGRTLARRDVEDGPAVRGRGGRFLGRGRVARARGRSGALTRATGYVPEAPRLDLPPPRTSDVQTLRGLARVCRPVTTSS